MRHMRHIRKGLRAALGDRRRRGGSVTWRKTFSRYDFRRKIVAISVFLTFIACFSLNPRDLAGRSVPEKVLWKGPELVIRNPLCSCYAVAIRQFIGMQVDALIPSRSVEPPYAPPFPLYNGERAGCLALETAALEKKEFFNR